MMVLGIISDERAWRSKSPGMHNTVLKKHGIQGIYLRFPVEAGRIGEAVAGLRALNIKGANVTVPYKEAVIPHLDHLSPEAKSIGAVNTIVLNGARLEGHNTDAVGFIEAIRGAGQVDNIKNAVIFGAGGAAKAVVHALKSIHVADITLIGRPPRLEETAGRLGVRSRQWSEITGQTLEAQLLINATSVSAPDEAPDLVRLLSGLDAPQARLLYDLNYGRKTNFWREWAKRAGITFQDGLSMLAYQARRSFTLWTGLEPPAHEFLEALEAA